MTNKTTHYIIDEELSGGNTTVYREYVEVDKEAVIGDKVIIVNAKPTTTMCGYKNGDIYDVVKRYMCSVETDKLTHNSNGLLRFWDDECKTLKPTGVVRINGKRYRLADRRAKRGDKVISKINDKVTGGFRIGDVFEVTRNCYGDGDAHNAVFTDKNGNSNRAFHYQSEYSVLEPIEGTTSQDDAQTLIANLASEVARLKREVAGLNRLTETHQSTIMQLLDHVDSNHKDIVKQAEEFAELTERVKTLEAQELVIDGEEIAEHLLTEVLMRERGTK